MVARRAQYLRFLAFGERCIAKKHGKQGALRLGEENTKFDSRTMRSTIKCSKYSYKASDHSDTRKENDESRGFRDACLDPALTPFAGSTLTWMLHSDVPP